MIYRISERLNGTLKEKLNEDYPLVNANVMVEPDHLILIDHMASILGLTRSAMFRRLFDISFQHLDELNLEPARPRMQEITPRGFQRDARGRFS
jgi:hypothetical protein